MHTYFSLGIVLSSDAAKSYSLVLLDYHLGKITIRHTHKNMHCWRRGFILRYSLKKHATYYTFDHVEIYTALKTHTYEELFFVHQVIELYQISFPEENSCKNIIAEFNDLLEQLSAQLNIQQKTLYILRIFWHTGLYTEQAIQKNRFLIQLFALPIELMFAQALECNYDELLYCVKSCIMHHPHREKFKLCTIGF